MTAFVANPTNALTCRTLKEASGAAEPVLVSTTGFEPGGGGPGGKAGRRPILQGREVPLRRPAGAGTLGRLWSGCLPLKGLG